MLDIVLMCKSRAGKKPGFLKKILKMFLKVFLGLSKVLGFFKFIFCKAHLGVAYVWWRQYVRNPTAASTTHNNKIADLIKLT